MSTKNRPSHQTSQLKPSPTKSQKGQKVTYAPKMYAAFPKRSPNKVQEKVDEYIKDKIANIVKLQ